MLYTKYGDLHLQKMYIVHKSQKKMSEYKWLTLTLGLKSFERHYQSCGLNNLFSESNGALFQHFVPIILLFSVIVPTQTTPFPIITSNDTHFLTKLEQLSTHLPTAYHDHNGVSTQRELLVLYDISIYRIDIECELNIGYEYLLKPTSTVIKNRY